MNTIHILTLTREELSADESEARLQALIASYPGATFEERLDACADANPWMHENLLPVDKRRAVGTRELAKQVRPLRKSLGLTQTQAAERMGVARTTVVAMEQGKRVASEADLAALRGEAGGA